MTLRADWFTGQGTGLQESDPFAVAVEEVGERIDLLDPRAKLELRVRELLYREGNLWQVGVTCPIKDRGETSCHACPVSLAHDRTQALGTLCRIGREQETVVTELTVLACDVK
jgi:hypothetical protein